MHSHRFALVAALVLLAAGCAGERDSDEAAQGELSASAPASPALTRETKEPEPIEDDPSGAYGVTARHMHLHARQLDELNAALGVGDLDGAATPAYWLSRHDTVAGMGEELQPYIDDMRRAAQEAEEAVDLASARSAAIELEQACDACHDAQDVKSSYGS